MLLDDMEEAERKEYVNEADKNGITPVFLARQKGEQLVLYLSGCVIACTAYQHVIASCVTALGSTGRLKGEPKSLPAAHPKLCGCVCGMSACQQAQRGHVAAFMASSTKYVPGGMLSGCQHGST